MCPCVSIYVINYKHLGGLPLGLMCIIDFMGKEMRTIRVLFDVVLIDRMYMINELYGFENMGDKCLEVSFAIFGWL